MCTGVEQAIKNGRAPPGLERESETDRESARERERNPCVIALPALSPARGLRATPQ